MTVHERPGVYSSYDASSVVSGRTGGGVVAIAAANDKGDGAVHRVTRLEEAAAAFGAEGNMTALVRLLFLNGASEVRAAAVKEGGYAAAFALLEQEEGVGVVVCDAATLSVQQALRDSVKTASAARRERIAVVCGGQGEAVAQLVNRAGNLNCERVVVAAPGGAEAACAVAGAIAAERDPAIPLGGAEVRGLTLGAGYDDNQLDTLIRGGVTPLEQVGGVVSVVRGVTTRTKTGEAADATWREISTIRIIDEVIPAIRNSLRAKFQRAKNTAQSRGAVRAQVVLELEDRVSREIIDTYENVAVTAKADDPTVCLVEFNFAVVHGLNQIWLTAHIAV